MFLMFSEFSKFSFEPSRAKAAGIEAQLLCA